MSRKHPFYAALAAGVVSFTLVIAPVQQARAQWAVIDAANLLQNTMNELNTLQTTVNQMTQIANQITQLGHEVQNLTNAPASVTSALLSQYVTTWSQLYSTWNSINGLASNLTTVATKYNTLFPNPLTSVTSPTVLTASQILTQTQSYVNEVRKDLIGANQVTAEVAQAQPALLGQLNGVLGQLNNAAGVTEVGNGLGQLQAIQAQQLQQIAELLMAINQAQATELGQQAQMIASDAAIAVTVAAPPTPAAAAPVAFYP